MKHIVASCDFFFLDTKIGRKGLKENYTNHSVHLVLWCQPQALVKLSDMGLCQTEMRVSTSIIFTKAMCFFSMFLVTRPRSFWLKTKKIKNWGSQNLMMIRAVDRRCHARNTCTLHLQTRLSGRRNFFTVIAMRMKNFLLIRSGWR